ncbi:hypothetical protein PV08_04090 [Exophiala spinifera]|uniref:Aminotransferase class V domain-containing protein n=1 Tax=Exophiala spinifera TaxID=91928 RepID=A0A0D2BE79_9EURO|nr:uncharacterized protein PV08_04090 [Exophiala spinifera]KIW16900.1 hypothetical protein PV08_04090 [Exophiala spinifera]
MSAIEEPATAAGAQKFGKAFGEEYFMFEPGYRHLNQGMSMRRGAFGGYPRPVRDSLRTFQDEVQAHPDLFIRYLYPERLTQSRRAVAQFLHANEDEVVLVPNATTGLNAVLRNIVYKPGDKIVYIEGIYGAIEKTVHYLVETTPVESIRVDFDATVNDHAKLLQSFQSTLQAHRGQVKLAIFDAVMSMPGVRMPFEELVRICKSNRVLSAVDAAHGIGLIDLDLNALDPDFLVSNCHKWLLTPHVCAVLYVPVRNQKLMRSTLPTSHGFVPLPELLKGRAFVRPHTEVTNEFVSLFQYYGTIDFGPPVCIPAAMAFRENICGGEENIRKYCRELASEGEARAAKILGTKPIPISEDERIFFANLRLPINVTSSESQDTEAVPLGDVPLVLDWIMRRLCQDYKAFVGISYISGALWARFSAMVYLEVDDFEYCARALKELSERVLKGGYKTG